MVEIDIFESAINQIPVALSHDFSCVYEKVKIVEGYGLLFAK